MKTNDGWKCDRCGGEKQTKRLPRCWKLRSGAHICGACWRNEPAERHFVLRYHVSHSGLHLPQEFWWQQRAAKLLWNKLVEIDEEAMAQVAAQRALYAPEATAAADSARLEAQRLWALAEELRNRAGDCEDPTTYTAAQKNARAASKRFSELYANAKNEAKKRGCDEAPIWASRDEKIAQAPQFEYVARDVGGRDEVYLYSLDEPPGAVPHVTWRLQRSLADQVVDEHKVAWSSWAAHHSDGRGMPRRHHGMALGRQVRAVLRYTNGQTLSHLTRGTPSFSLRPAGLSRCGKPAMAFKMAVGGGKHAEGVAVVDRPIPEENGAIRRIELVGRRWADGWDCTLNITCRIPLKELPHGKRCEAVAVDLRWRRDPDTPSNLMVAEWAATNGSFGQVWIDLTKTCSARALSDPPTSWEGYRAKQAEMDKRFENLKALIWERYGSCERQDQFRLMRSKGILRNRDRWPNCAAEIDEWYAWHQTMLRRMAKLRDKLIARRDQLYYEQAHVICQTADTIILESDANRGNKKMSIKALAEAPNSPAGNQRHMLAPGRFRMILLDVAQRYGCAEAYVDKIGTSMVCPGCGATVSPGAQDVSCQACGTRWTRPEGATAEMLRRWKEQSGDGGNGSSRKQGKPSNVTISYELQLGPITSQKGDDVKLRSLHAQP